MYNGLPITYDEIGNPTKIVTNQYWASSSNWEEYAYELEWEGRQLIGRRFYELYSGCDIWYDEYYDLSFEYNADGIRTSKTVYDIEYKYLLNGTQIIGETWTSYGTEYLLLYIYDETGAPIGIKYRTSAYAANTFDYFFFEKNLQGDIVAIYNAEGEKIGSYVYDAWGNFTVSTVSGNTSLENSIVNSYNPFRYRGYYYDKDLGWYYLQSRYYNPQWGRFVNADDVAVVTATPMSLTDKNLYAYCDNNPVMRTDWNGDFWETAFDIVSLGFSIADVCKDPSDPWAWAGLVGDAIDLIPFVAGVGEVTRAVNTGRKVASKVDDVVDGTIDTYKALKKADSSIGKEVHHIVEKRLAPALKIDKKNTGDMLSIALDKQTHRNFTNLWRQHIPYGTNYNDLKPSKIWEAAQKVYAGYPNLLEAARKTIFN